MPDTSGTPGAKSFRKNLLNLRQFFARKIQIARRADAIVHLAHAARADERARHRLVPQHPRQRHLRQRLPARLREVVQFFRLRQQRIRDVGRAEKSLVMTRA